MVLYSLILFDFGYQILYASYMIRNGKTRFVLETAFNLSSGQVIVFDSVQSKNKIYFELKEVLIY
jgi:hypothetical protein